MQTVLSCRAPSNPRTSEVRNSNATHSSVFDSLAAKSVAEAIDSHDFVSTIVRGFGAPTGTFTYASSEAYSFFSSGFVA